MKIRSGFVSNSSSSSFLCNTDKTPSEIESKLRAIIDLVKDDLGCGSYDDSVREIRSISLAKFKEIRQQDYGSNVSINEEDHDARRILIEGSYDNSIPYELFGLIERMWDARRYFDG